VCDEVEKLRAPFEQKADGSHFALTVHFQAGERKLLEVQLFPAIERWTAKSLAPLVPSTLLIHRPNGDWGVRDL